MTSKPNMKDLHDKHPAAFSPQPFAIAGFFSPQQILQLLWIRELWRKDSESSAALCATRVVRHRQRLQLASGCSSGSVVPAIVPKSRH